ncbi:MAG: hypothetical protein AAB966_03110, partial [Patescibacteria group bacterium]
MFGHYLEHAEGTFFERCIRIIEKQMKKMTKEPYYGYFSGEAESKSSRYEKLANFSSIGVLAKDKIHAQVLLLMTKCVVDWPDNAVEFFDRIIMESAKQQNEDTMLDDDDVLMKHACIKRDFPIDSHDVSTRDSQIKYGL